MEQEIDLLALVKTIWTQRKRIIVWTLCGLIIGIIVAFSLPKEYTSYVKMAPESSVSAGSNMQFSMNNLTSMIGITMPNGNFKAGIDENVYPDVLTAAPFLWEFSSIKIPRKGEMITFEEYLNKYERKAWWEYLVSAPGYLIGWMFSFEKSEKPTYTSLNPSPEQLMFESKLSKRISITKDRRTGTYMLSATMQDPIVATIIADSVIVKLQRYMVDYYTSKTRNDLKSNTEMLEQARQEYYKADSIYNMAIEKNQNLIAKSTKNKLDLLQNERDLSYQIYQQLATQVKVNQLKLQEQTPVVTIIEPARIPNRASTPKSVPIILAFTLLGGFIASGVVIIKTSMPKQ